MSTNTSNYGLVKPAPNDPVDADVWGTELNNDLDGIDGLFKSTLNFTTSSKTATFTAVAPTAGSTTLGDSHKLFLCDATTASIVANLPAASTTGSGYCVIFKKIDSSSNTITVTPNGTDTIDGATTFSLGVQYRYIILVSDGVSTWNIISRMSSLVINRQIFTSSGTYTPTAGLSYADVDIIGGGGGGGGCVASTGSGGGGGAGERRIATFSAATIGASQAITIGSAGTGSSGANGGNGGSTSIGSLLVAAGGTGGLVGNSIIVSGGLGGTGGSGGNGFPGQSGAFGTGFGYGFGGSGGNSIYGSAGAAIGSVTSGTSVAGNNAIGYGAGGGGAAQLSGANNAGGSGSIGLVIITEYLSP